MKLFSKRFLLYNLDSICFTITFNANKVVPAGSLAPVLEVLLYLRLFNGEGAF